MDLQRFRDGDPRYFEEIIREMGPLVIGAIGQFTNCQDVADDMFQEVWLRVYEKRTQFKGSGSFGGWLHRLTRRTCLTRIRRDAARERAGRLFWGRRAEEHREVAPRALGKLFQSRREEVLALVGRLPDRQYQIVWLRYFEDYSTAEVAERLGLKEATVRSNLRHALESLRQLLPREEIE